MAGTREVQYLVLPDSTNPYLLARVRWPDICQAMSPVRPDWQEDPGLFDLPYDPCGTPVTFEQAAAIAAEWGTHFPREERAGTAVPSLMRRMPANWSNLSRAERNAWSLEYLKTRKRAAAEARPPRRRWRRRQASPWFEPVQPPQDEPVLDLTAVSDDMLPGAAAEANVTLDVTQEPAAAKNAVIDLTDMSDDAPTVEGA